MRLKGVDGKLDEIEQQLANRTDPENGHKIQSVRDQYEASLWNWTTRKIHTRSSGPK